MDRRANWNFPNNCSIDLALLSGSSLSRAFAKSITIPFTSPLLESTMPLRLMPKPCINSEAFSVGLISEARPDLRALAPSDALIPPSFMAVRKKARSSTSPPSCLITGPALGIAMVKSSMEVTVWFSTAFRKLIFFARSSVAVPNALVRDIVVASACSFSTLPSTASLVASATCAKRSAPCLPIAAASAARPMVFSTATPYLVYSAASAWMSLTMRSVSSLVVKSSPYTRLKRRACSSIFMNVLLAAVPRYAKGIVKPTISCLPAH